MVGGYFFVVMLITPKTTTATKLSNKITSLVLIVSPPFQEVNNLAASLDYMFSISYCYTYVNAFLQSFLNFPDMLSCCSGFCFIKRQNNLSN